MENYRESNRRRGVGLKSFSSDVKLKIKEDVSK